MPNTTLEQTGGDSGCTVRACMCARGAAEGGSCEWFRAQGPGYQTRINAVLRAIKDASPNNTLERAVEAIGPIVLAMDCVLAEAQWRWRPAAQPGR